MGNVDADSAAPKRAESFPATGGDAGSLLQAAIPSGFRGTWPRALPVWLLGTAWNELAHVTCRAAPRVASLAASLGLVGGTAATMGPEMEKSAGHSGARLSSSATASICSQIRTCREDHPESEGGVSPWRTLKMVKAILVVLALAGLGPVEEPECWGDAGHVYRAQHTTARASSPRSHPVGGPAVADSPFEPGPDCSATRLRVPAAPQWRVGPQPQGDGPRSLSRNVNSVGLEGAVPSPQVPRVHEAASSRGGESSDGEGYRGRPCPTHLVRDEQSGQAAPGLVARAQRRGSFRRARPPGETEC
ncbi:unnamed protein product [Lampetra fluviatilis]